MIQVLENNGDFAVLRNYEQTVDDLIERPHVFPEDLGYLFIARRADFPNISKSEFRAHYKIGSLYGSR